MANVVEFKQRAARARYASKVCRDYLGIETKACEAVFDKLLANMKTGIQAFSV